MNYAIEVQRLCQQILFSLIKENAIIIGMI